VIIVRSSVEGDRAAAARIGGVGDRAQNAGPALEAMREVFYRTEERRYATNAWGSWEPNVASTTSRKARRGQDLRTERATGNTYRSLTQAGPPDAIWRPSTDSAVIGTSADNAQWQQKGSGPEHREIVGAPTRAFTRVMRKWMTDGVT
jgi:hypothetical protein